MSKPLPSNSSQKVKFNNKKSEENKQDRTKITHNKNSDTSKSDEKPDLKRKRPVEDEDEDEDEEDDDGDKEEIINVDFEFF